MNAHLQPQGSKDMLEMFYPTAKPGIVPIRPYSFFFHGLIRLTAASRKAESPQNHRPTHPFVNQNCPFIILHKLKNTQDFAKDIGC